MKVTILCDKDATNEHGYIYHTVELSIRWQTEDMESTEWEFPRLTANARTVLSEFLPIRNGWRRVKSYFHVIPSASMMFAKVVDEQIVMIDRGDN